jgi:hypothetical protein
MCDACGYCSDVLAICQAAKQACGYFNTAIRLVSKDLAYMFKIKRKSKPRTEHAYRVRLDRMIHSGMLPTSPGLHELYVRHDPHCKLLRGGFCNCNPDFEFLPETDYSTPGAVN